MNKYTILSTNTHDKSSIHSIALTIVCIIFAMVLSYFTNMLMTTAQHVMMMVITRSAGGDDGDDYISI